MNAVYPIVWFSTAVHGQVVDDDTGAPVPDAAVVASWRLVGLELSTVRCLQLAEVITGPDGTFRIPGWGPRFHFGPGVMLRTQPELHAVADGYSAMAVSSSRNVTSAYMYAGPGTNGQVIELRRSANDPAGKQDITLLLRLAPEKVEGCDRSRLPQTLERLAHARVSP